MEPILDEATARFCGLSQHDRARFLALLAHNLTVAARTYYEFQAPGITDPPRFREFNELLHCVTSYLGHILGGDEDIGWAAVVAQTVLEPDDARVAHYARQAWMQAERSVRDVS